VLGEPGHLLLGHRLAHRGGAVVALAREPAAARLLEVHLEDVDAGQPGVALGPQPVLALAAEGERADRAVPVEQDHAVAVGPDVLQRRLAHLVVGDGHADERLGVERELDVAGQDRAHEPGLGLAPGVLVFVGELHDVAAVGVGTDAGEVDVRHRREQVLDRRLVLLADVHDRADPVGGLHQRRQRGDRVERASRTSRRPRRGG
jgi:hypothetical protein